MQDRITGSGSWAPWTSTATISSSRPRSSGPTHSQPGLRCEVATPVGDVRAITTLTEALPTRWRRAALVNRISNTHSVRHRRLCQTEPQAECEAGLAAGPGRTGRHTGTQRGPRDQPCDLRYRPRNSPLHPLRGSPRVSGTPPVTHTMTGTTGGFLQRRPITVLPADPPDLTPRQLVPGRPRRRRKSIRLNGQVPVCARPAWLPPKRQRQAFGQPAHVQRRVWMAWVAGPNRPKLCHGHLIRRDTWPMRRCPWPGQSKHWWPTKVSALP